MNEQLYFDAQMFPKLFSWNGPINRQELEQWIIDERLNIPEALKELWASTGGGDMFETETLLRPFANDGDYDDIRSVNATFYQRGLSSQYLVFHTGIIVSAVRTRDGIIAVLDSGSLKEKRTCSSLETWYTSTIRREYAHRYGLQEACMDG